jgi:hypothetical protein
MLLERLKKMPVAAMIAYGSERQRQSQQRTSHRYFLPSFGTFGQTVSEENNIKQQVQKLFSLYK